MPGSGHSGDGAPRRPSPEPLPALDPSAAIEDSGRIGVPIRTWVTSFLAVFGVAAVAFLISMWVDVLTQTIPEGTTERITVASVFRSVLMQDVEQARQTLGGMSEVMAAILGLALTVSSIIVQLAATRFTPQVTSLFFRARTNILVLGFLVVGAIFVLWVNYSVGHDFVPHWGVLGSMGLLTASMLLLFPYFAWVFSFLEPDSIIGRITTVGLSNATPIRSRFRSNLSERQRQAVESIEHLANIGLNAVQQKDKNIASTTADALCTFGTAYGDTKAGMVNAWHEIGHWNRQSPDFVSLSNEAIGDLRQRQTWLEWKILRQYQMLFAEGLVEMKDLCYLIAINTRRLAEAAARRGDLHAVDLAIKFFNTYLRATINANDIRTAYNILHQYRQLGEYVIQARVKDNLSHIEELERRGLDVARFMRYYSSVFFQRKMAFITEVVAHDVGTLCEFAFKAESPVHEELLATFLKVDDATESGDQEKTLRGVRRAQVKLATTYLEHGNEKDTHQIFTDMKDEPLDRLRSIWQELRNLDSREFWEVNDRGTNFNYLTPSQKEALPVFFAQFPGLDLDESAAQ